jgi:parallel beta-helix repeat protein
MSVNLFDTKFYRATNADLVGMSNAQAQAHFQKYGLNEGRQFSPFANLNFYRSSNSDLNNLSNKQLFEQLQNSGVAEGRKFSQFFDLNYYKAINGDLVTAGLNNEQLLEHFRDYGLEEGRFFSPTIESDYYRTSKPDLVAAGLNRRQSYEHFQLYGMQQGHLASPYFNAKVYLENNADLVKAFGEYNYGEAYNHFVRYGQQEGRFGSDYAGNSLSTARNLGTLSDHLTLTDFVGSTDTSDYYRFNWNTAGNISVFLNGLAAGTTLELLGSNGNVLQSSTNSGTTVGGITKGSITTNLAAGTYYVRVAPADVSGNALYANKDFYNLVLQPHDAPNTVTVAASNTALKSGADFVATGVNDEQMIEQALAAVSSKGGTVLLLDGTFNISDNIDITKDNITLSGVGWSTVLRTTDNTTFEDAGMLRSAFHTTEENIATPYFSRQHFKHMALNGNKANQISDVNSYANFGTYKDSSFEDIRAHDFGAYGFDPHENSDAVVPTIRLTLKNSLADRNGKDGVTIDNCVDSTIVGNISDSNVRHGYNIVTDTDDNIFLNNVATYNGGNGFVIQSGTELEKTSDGNKLIGNISKFNMGAGILNYLGSDTEIIGNVVSDNNLQGIRLRSVSDNTVRGNILLNNSQLENNRYDEISLDNNVTPLLTTKPVYSTNNSVTYNRIVNNKTVRARYAITERSTNENYNILAGNTFDGTLKGIRLQGANSKVLF